MLCCGTGEPSSVKSLFQRLELHWHEARRRVSESRASVDARVVDGRRKRPCDSWVWRRGPLPVAWRFCLKLAVEREVVRYKYVVSSLRSAVGLFDLQHLKIVLIPLSQASAHCLIHSTQSYKIFLLYTHTLVSYPHSPTTHTHSLSLLSTPESHQYPVSFLTTHSGIHTDQLFCHSPALSTPILNINTTSALHHHHQPQHQLTMASTRQPHAPAALTLAQARSELAKIKAATDTPQMTTGQAPPPTKDKRKPKPNPTEKATRVSQWQPLSTPPPPPPTKWDALVHWCYLQQFLETPSTPPPSSDDGKGGNNQGSGAQKGKTRTKKPTSGIAKGTPRKNPARTIRKTLKAR